MLTAVTPEHQEVAMNRIHRAHRIRPIRRCTAALVVLAGAMLVVTTTAPAAFAMLPGGGGSMTQRPAPPHKVLPAHLHALAAGGMVAWQVAVIAAGTAVLAAVATLVLDRARAARHGRAVAA
jgi:hypothetical protein